MKNKVIVIIFIALIIIIFLIVAGNLSRPPSPDVKQTVYPALGIQYANPSISKDPKLDTLSFPNNLPLIKKVISQEDSDKKAKTVASSLGIEDQYEGIHTQTKLRKSVINGDEVYTWIDNDKLLTYYLKTGVFEYSSAYVESTLPTDEQRARETIISLLTKDALLPSEYQITVEFLKLPEFSLSTPNNFSLYKISLIPKLNNIPILTYKNNGQIITFLLNRDFSIFKGDYLYIPLQVISETISIRSFTDALNQVTKATIKPSFIDIPNLYPEPDINSIAIINLTLINAELVYYINPKDEEVIYPTYKITANIQTKQGLAGTAIFMVSAQK